MTLEMRPDQTETEHQIALKTAGQRNINRIWELTQASVAILVTMSTLYVSSQIALREGPSATSSFILLSNAFFLVIGFYFGRTNHQRTGGVGGSDEGR